MPQCDADQVFPSVRLLIRPLSLGAPLGGWEIQDHIVGWSMLMSSSCALIHAFRQDTFMGNIARLENWQISSSPACSGKIWRSKVGYEVILCCSQRLQGYFTQQVLLAWIFHYGAKSVSNETALNIHSHTKYPQHLRSQGVETFLPPNAVFTPSALILNCQNCLTPQIFTLGYIICHKAYLN